MPLTHEEMAGFMQDGPVIRRTFVPQDLITRASSLIERWFRENVTPPPRSGSGRTAGR